MLPHGVYFSGDIKRYLLFPHHPDKQVFGPLHAESSCHLDIRRTARVGDEDHMVIMLPLGENLAQIGAQYVGSYAGTDLLSEFRQRRARIVPVSGRM